MMAKDPVTVLVTRPAGDAETTAHLVESLGFRALTAPVMTVHDLGATLPDPVLYKGIVFTSANGVRSFQRLMAHQDNGSAYSHIPVFAVGEHTALQARKAGFTTVHYGSGTLQSLIPVIRQHLEVPARLLHLRGRDRADDPRHYLALIDGWAVDDVILYKTRAAETMPEAVLDALRQGAVGAVLLYSAKSAECFAAVLRRHWPEADLAGVKALCLADSVVESAGQLNWAEILVAPSPDQAGMTRLLKSLKAMTSDSTLPPDAHALNDAEKIIERFGGIRPMATKMNVPVTTVQGWKKRNVIPGNRRQDVLDAAREHQVDLAGLTGEGEISASAGGDATKTNDFTENLARARQEQDTRPESLKPHQDAIAAARATEAAEEKAKASLQGSTAKPMTYDMMMKEIKKAQVQAVRRSVVAASAVVVLFGVGATLLVMAAKQQVEKNQARIAALEQSVEQIEDTAVPATGITAEMGSRLAELRGKAEELQTTIAGLKTQAESFIGPENASLSERLMTLEQRFQALIGGNSDLSLVLQRIQEMQASMQGQQQMQSAVEDLKNLVAGLQGQVDTMDSALVEEQQSDSALGQALEGVSPEELKAAAMLIGLSQFRDSMNRSGPFEADLALLQKMIGEKDPVLNAEIERLAPYAEKGVLSPRGLSNELKGLAGDIVVSSLKGEDVSIQDKALGRFQEVLKIQKDGQMVLGSDTQATVARAQQLLDAGEVDAAVAELQTLQGPARQTAQPLIDEAQITAMAQKVQTMLTTSVMGQIRMPRGGGGAVPYTARPSPFGGAITGGGFMGPSVAVPRATAPVVSQPEAAPETTPEAQAETQAETVPPEQSAAPDAVQE